MATTDELYGALEDFLVRLLGMAESQGMDRLVQLDLSFSQARTLFSLAHAQGPSPINVVAERLRLSDAAAGRTVESLVRLGLVERRESDVDRRVKLVSLTTEGQEIAAGHVESKRQAVRTFVNKLPAPLGDQLYDALLPVIASDAIRSVNQENCP